MQRRTLLGMGVAGAALLTAIGIGTAIMFEPAWRDGKLLPAGRRVLVAIAGAVLDGSLPSDVSGHDEALADHVNRVQSAIAAMPPHTQGEIATLLALLGTAAGRLGLAGLTPNWESASVSEVQSALQSMRQSSLLVRRQVFTALRDLTLAAYFADPSTWRVLNYPGPRMSA